MENEAMNLDEFLQMSLDERRKAHVRRKPRGAYNRRPKRTPEELIEYLRSHNIRSVRQLRKVRKPDEPHYHDIIKAFGSWKAAREEAFGQPEPFALPKRPEPEYIIKAVAEYDLWTRDEYAAAHRRRPDVVPSPYWVRVLFGTWDKLKWAAEQISMKASLERWLSLRRRLGRNPTMDELNQHGITLEPLRCTYTTTKELTDFLNQIGKIADKKEKASAQNFPRVSQPNPPVESPRSPNSNNLPTPGASG